MSLASAILSSPGFCLSACAVALTALGVSRSCSHSEACSPTIDPRRAKQVGALATSSCQLDSQLMDS
jgi:hypothetical protein